MNNIAKPLLDSFTFSLKPASEGGYSLLEDGINSSKEKNAPK
jgi:hypothetical protein